MGIMYMCESVAGLSMETRQKCCGLACECNVNPVILVRML
jgi:hypothetical protein